MKATYTRDEVIAILERAVMSRIVAMTDMVTVTEMRLCFDNKYACAEFAVTAQEAERELVAGTSFIKDKEAKTRRMVATTFLEAIDP